MAFCFVGETRTNSSPIRVFWQQLSLTWIAAPNVPALGSSWLFQQHDWFARVSTDDSLPWQRHVPRVESEQQEPPQQQPLPEDEIPRQNSLCCPFGQRQSKWGTLAISVVTAVNQASPACTALTMSPMQVFFPTLSTPSRPISATPGSGDRIDPCGRCRWKFVDGHAMPLKRCFCQFTTATLNAVDPINRYFIRWLRGLTGPARAESKTAMPYGSTLNHAPTLAASGNLDKPAGVSLWEHARDLGWCFPFAGRGIRSQSYLSRLRLPLLLPGMPPRLRWHYR